MVIMAHIYNIAIAMALLFGVTGLIISNVGPEALAQTRETANKQMDEAMKALDSGDNAAAEEDMTEADKTLPEGQAKFHLGEAIKSLQAGDVQGAKMHLEAAQNSPQ
jgi:cellobiose-specific phosphotransferase system component IIA